MLRSNMLRAARGVVPTARPQVFSRAAAPIACQQSRSAHAISNPELANIEKRWEEMPPQEQAELWMNLRDRMKAPWTELTIQEKKAAYHIAFGPHGPRAEAPPGEGLKILKYVTIGVGFSLALFYFTRIFARGPPKTMSAEWQEASNAYLKKENIEPITGISSEGYKGPGMVQSKKTGLVLEPVEEDEDDE
ncbi:cytochrome c oxidase polypeptide 5 [Venturia nashicola]|uniref:Cytochrome c oxidase polypeptide V n=1 Tax=Venturia nashicola TaxID=86259 RepID=A0A4Z1P1W3_9PEZI|nr:cytochrome c oxidase polypeptide 5 [Venturia nashicola]TLD31987.1 cytochrome c oxidase polypeptide 5 [Venturia nashicola]